MTGAFAYLGLFLAVSIASAGAGSLAYFGAKSLRPPGDQQSIDLANAVVLRIAILHALIVALAFAEVKQNEQDMRRLIADEAMTLTDVFYDLRRYDPAATEEAQRLAIRYAEAVARDEWASLARTGTLSETGWEHWRALLEAVLVLEPQDRRGELIHDRVMANVYSLEDRRQSREISAQAAPHMGFWLAAIAGLFIICACFAPYPARRSTYVFISLFAGFTGAVLYLAWDISAPFSGLSVIPPEGFESFLRQPLPAALN